MTGSEQHQQIAAGQDHAGPAAGSTPPPPRTSNPDEEGLRHRLAFLGLTGADAEQLRACRDQFDTWADALFDNLYRHLVEFDEPSRFLREPSAVAQLISSQKQLFRLMLTAQWNQSYAERRRDVGRIHAERGVEPEYFLGTYNWILQGILEHTCCGQGVGATNCLPSMLKAIFLDIGLSLDEYFAQSTRNLRKALEMYWDANNELKQFAHLTSHDLKTPLATVANLCDEVLDEFGEQIPAEARQLIISARRTVFRMSSTVDELLSTTISNDTVGYENEVSTTEIVREAVERVRPEFEKKDIELIVPEMFPNVIANPVQLREIVYNLLSNAVKYMDKPVGYIEIRVTTSDSHCTLSVHDNGPGIPEEYLTRIFAPFHRLSMHRSQAGSGLGLYFTKYLVEQQGGRIWVESELGRGSIFHVELKRKPSGADLPC